MTKLTKLIVIGASSLLLSACGGSSSVGSAGGGGADGGSGGSGGGTTTTEEIGIQKAKVTIQELRTQALTVIDYDDSGQAGYLDQEGLSIGNALENCSMDTSTSAEAISTIVVNSMEAMESEDHNYSEVDGDNSLDITCDAETNICTYALSYNNLAYNGVLTIPDIDMEDFDFNDFEVLNAAFNGTVPYDDESINDSNLQTFDFDLTVTKTDDGADIALTNISLEQGTTSASISNLEISTGYSGDDEIEINYIKLNSITLNGTCENYTAMGTIILLDYVENESLLDAKTGSWVPSQLLFEGQLTNTVTNGSIAGNIDIDLINAATMSKEDNPILNVNINGTLAMPERPKMDLELTYSNEGENEDTYHNFTASYGYDNTEINIDGTLDEVGENGQVVITDNNNIRVLIIIENGDLVEGNSETKTGSIVTYNGTLIGTLEDLRNGLIVIKYTDGTFESLP